MAAISMYAYGKWDDNPECVPPTIRRLCTALSDMLPGERERFIGPHLCKVLGRDASPEAERQRTMIISDWVFKEITLDEHQGTLDRWFAYMCVKTAHEVSWGVSVGNKSEIERVSKYASLAAMNFFESCSEYKKSQILQSLLDLILRLCEVGEKKYETIDRERMDRAIKEVFKVRNE